MTIKIQDLPFITELELLGADLYTVGGSNRNHFLDIPPKDLDILVGKLELDKILDYEKVSDKRCFIATACYDDYNSEEVIVLRNFRDNKLQKSFVGKIFVRLYYQISPTLANFIYKHDGLKSFIRRHILDRIVAIVDTI